MGEKLTIINFAGLGKVQFELQSINILIGKQASGKSVAVKLIYFFKLLLDSGFQSIYRGKPTKAEIEQRLLGYFTECFPPDTWPNTPFSVRYEFGIDHFEVKGSSRRLSIEYSKGVNQFWDECRKLCSPESRVPETTFVHSDRFPEFQKKANDRIREKFKNRSSYDQIFLPAGRTFFTTLKNVIVAKPTRIDHADSFLNSFGRNYEVLGPLIVQDFKDPSRKGGAKFSRRLWPLIREIVGADVVIEEDIMYLVHADGRRVKVGFSSSAQQETIPLALMLAFVSAAGFLGRGATVYIEEPETHLFPSAQKKMVELIASIYNDSKYPLQFIITTHSPYVLATFSNLLYAGHLFEQGVDAERIDKVVPAIRRLRPGDVGAIAMQKGRAVNLIDKKNGMISANILDKASEDITSEFDRLLNLE